MQEEQRQVDEDGSLPAGDGQESLLDPGSRSSHPGSTVAPAPVASSAPSPTAPQGPQAPRKWGRGLAAHRLGVGSVGAGRKQDGAQPLSVGEASGIAAAPSSSPALLQPQKVPANGPHSQAPPTAPPVNAIPSPSSSRRGAPSEGGIMSLSQLREVAERKGLDLEGMLAGARAKGIIIEYN